MVSDKRWEKRNAVEVLEGVLVCEVGRHDPVAVQCKGCTEKLSRNSGRDRMEKRGAEQW